MNSAWHATHDAPAARRTAEDDESLATRNCDNRVSQSIGAVLCSAFYHGNGLKPVSWQPDRRLIDAGSEHAE